MYTRDRLAGPHPAGELEAGVRIVVLVKPVPEATGQERLGPDGRLDRTSAPTVLNGNDEYTLEAALRPMEYDVVLAGADSADGEGGVVGAWTPRPS